MTVAVDVDEVTVRLGDATVLDGVSTGIDEGRLVGLIGPNGAGKTTLLRTINGRLSPDAGTVRLLGDRISDISARAVARRVATVPQHTDLSFAFTVREAVEMGRHPHRSRLSVGDPGRDAVDRALDRAGIVELADRPVIAVSGGERQRVLIARALAQETPILLLDEPTASLDIHHRVRLLGLVRRLVDEAEKTVLAAIHDLDLAARYCDDVLLLADGAVRASGPPKTVLAEDALESAFDARVAVGRDAITGTPSVTALPAGGRSGRVHVVCGGGSGTGLLYDLVAAGYDVTVGPLHEGDADLAAANALSLDAATGRAFAPFDDRTVERAAAFARGADAVVVAPLHVGPANAAALEVAAAGGPTVVVDGEPFDARNAAGVEAGDRYERLRKHGRVVSPDDVPSAVAAAIDTPGEQAVTSD